MTRQKSLLIEEPPLQVLPQLAKIIGLNEAILLQQIHYWLGRSENVRHGRKWVYKTAQEWVDEFPFWSEATVKRAVSTLKAKGLILVDKESSTSWNRTNWYSVDYDALGRIGAICTDASDQVAPMHESKLTESIGSSCAIRSDQIDPITISTETTSETTTETAFESFWKAYPRRAGNNPKRAALKAYRGRIAEKHTDAEILAGVTRYAAFCRATSKEGGEYVLRASTFLGPDKPFLQGWDLPAEPTIGAKPWWATEDSILAKGAELGLKPNPGESWPNFKSRVSEEIVRRRPKVAA